MKKEHQEILELLKKYLESDPELRFGQALFNLRINEYCKTTDPENPNYNLRDIHGDSDQDIKSRIESQLNWFKIQKTVTENTENIEEFEGLTVNERLHKYNLFEIFDSVKNTKRDYAEYILRRLKVDHDSVKKYFENI